MIYARTGDTFEAVLEGAPSGLEGTIGVRVIDPLAGTTVIARSTAGIVEAPAGSGVYVAELTAPADPSVLLVVWDIVEGGDPLTPDSTFTDQLEVIASAPPLEPVPPPTAADTTFTATLPAPPGVTGLGARVEVPVTRAIASAWQPATLVGDTWTVTLDRPLDAGDYLLVWRTNDPEPPDYETFVPLAVTSAGVPATGPDWTPTLADVAALCPAYTRHDIDFGAMQAGAEAGVFDEETDPTATDVQGYIAAAVQEVTGRVGLGFDALRPHADLARRTAAWHAAATVEAEKQPEGTDEATSAYRWKQASYVACLNELITQARSGSLRLASEGERAPATGLVLGG